MTLEARITRDASPSLDLLGPPAETDVAPKNRSALDAVEAIRRGDAWACLWDRLAAPRARVTLVLLVVALHVATTALAHGPFEERLERTREEIGKHPRDPLPLLERAELYRTEGRLAQAIADVARAAALAPGLPSVALMRARIDIDAREPRAACAVLDSLLARTPGLGEARALRAEALEAQGRTREAAEELERATGELHRVTPEHYVHLARLFAASRPPQPERARRALERGVERLGPAPALIEQGIGLELSQGRPARALRWHERLGPYMENDPSWLARRGELLEAAGRDLEALAAYTAALEAIEALPTDRRAAPATKALEAATRARLHR